MAHPKRKTSKTRRDKRRTHYKASDAQIATDKTHITNMTCFFYAMIIFCLT